MDDFLMGLSKEEQEKYMQLTKKINETEEIDIIKRYLPKLIILKEKGRLELLKKKKKE